MNRLTLGILLVVAGGLVAATFVWGLPVLLVVAPSLIAVGALWLATTGRLDFARTAASRLRSTVKGDALFIFWTLVGLGLIWLLVTLLTEPLVLRAAQVDASGNVVKEAWTFSWSLATFWILLAYFIFSWRFWALDEKGNFTIEGLYDPKKPTGYIRADEIAVRQIAGRQIDVLDSGLPFAPLLVVQLSILPIKVQQKEFPNEPAKIARSKDDALVPEGFSPPERVTFRTSITQAQVAELLGDDETVIDVHGQPQKFIVSAPDDGLAKRVTAEVVPVVRWTINRAEAKKFVKNIGSVDEANRQIEDEMFAVLGRLLPNMSAGQAKQNMRWISAHLYQAVIKRTEEWGITIESAFLKAIRFNHALNAAIALRAEAEFQGRGERKLIEERGAGTAKAAGDLVRARLDAQAEGLKKLAADLGIQGEQAIAQFVAGQLAESGSTVVLGLDGFSQLAGAAGAALIRNNNRAGGQQNP